MPIIYKDITRFIDDAKHGNILICVYNIFSDVVNIIAIECCK